MDTKELFKQKFHLTDEQFEPAPYTSDDILNALLGIEKEVVPNAQE